MNAHTAVAALPHREPFLFVTRVTRLEDGWAEAEWDVTGGEEWLRGHFPGNAIVPGVLLGEALAQTAGIALSATLGPDGCRGQGGLLAKIDLRFHTPVRPPACIRLVATRTGSMGALHQFDVAAACGGQRAAHGSLVLAVPQTTEPR